MKSTGVIRLRGMMKPLPVVLMTLLVTACPESPAPIATPDAAGTDAATDSAADAPAMVPLAPPPEGEGFQLSFHYTVPAASEAWICDILPLPNTTVANVNWVEVQQTPGTHHLTLSTLGLIPSANPLPAGRYDCNELYGDQSLMEDQIMFFGNQGSAEDVMQLPEGVAATLPGGLNIIYEMHYVNASNKEVELYSYINAWTISDAEVVDGIWGGTVRDEHINIPAGPTTHTEWTRCAMNRDVDVLFLASHMHEKGVEFTIRPWDGVTTGDVMYTNSDWHIPLITQYDPPLSVPAGEGFEFSCTWSNTSAEVVNYGNTAADEMCNLAVVFKPFDLSGLCEVVESSDGVLWSPQ